MDTGHWEQYRSYNTTDDATTLLDIAQQLEALSEEDDEAHWMAQALAGIGQRLSRLPTQPYPVPDPIPEHWGPEPQG